jgi:hypothetical protein
MAISRLLVIAPDSDLRGSLVFALEAEGFEVTAREGSPGCHGWPRTASIAPFLIKKAVAGEPYESIAFCVKAYPVVLLSWLVEWVS